MGANVRNVLILLRQRKRSLPYSELQQLMKQADCRLTTTAEGCRITHPSVRGFVAMVAQPHGRGAGKDVREAYVKNCIRLLERALEAEEEPDEGQSS